MCWTNGIYLSYSEVGCEYERVNILCPLIVHIFIDLNWDVDGDIVDWSIKV